MALHRAAQIAQGDGDVVRILSIDGGGMRGIVPAVLLAELERRAGRPLSRVFDLVAGTSTGGILALGLAKPGPGGGPQYDPAALCRLYQEEGKAIFHRSLPHLVASAGGLLGPKYAEEGIERVLRRYFGEVRMGEALTRVLVTSYDTAACAPYFFKSFRPAPAGFAAAHQGAASPDDFPMWCAARATSAAPTFFPPFGLQPLERTEPARCLVDGGVFANNPAMCALAEAARRFPDRKYLLVSVGTGAEQEQLLYREVRGFGLAGWALPILKVVFDGVSDSVDYQLGQVLGPTNYFRFQCDSQGIPMDDASDDAVQRLLGLGQRLVKDSARELDRLAPLLA